MNEYKIHIYTTPHIHDHADAPYFWAILKWVEDEYFSEWVNTGKCGWAINPQKAWEEAYEQYNLSFR